MAKHFSTSVTLQWSRQESTWKLLYLWATVLTVLQVVHHCWWWWKEDVHSSQPPAGDLTLIRPSPSSCSECVRHALRHPLIWHDKRLISHLRDTTEVAPRALGHDLDPHHPPWAHIPSYNVTEENIRNILQRQEGGVFVEVGAQDGVWLSNTWWLEAARGWRGLLVEADPLNYHHLRNSPRTSPTLPVCVTTGLTPTQEKFVRTRSPSKVTEEVYRNQLGHSKLLKYATTTEVLFGETWTTTCYPLFSVLTASRYRQVDLLILDVYGGGMEMTLNFITRNNQLKNKFHVQMILYQDNELQQFFSINDVKESFKQEGYNLFQLNQFHYLALMT
ncbi:uncharacterized protein [Cherax quadricarinatus]|uniref:uncharacterized protein n=1 Tax=Cherax quadricarinatus TaxID=27406 RepID=UPI00387E7162